MGFFGVVLMVLGMFGGGVIGEMKLWCCFLNVGCFFRELVCFLEEFSLGNVCVLGNVLCFVFIVLVRFFFECFLVEDEVFFFVY